MTHSSGVRHLLRIGDLSRDSLESLLSFAADLKAAPIGAHLGGKTLALVFQKPSLRTRVSFDVAMAQQGGRALYLSPPEVGIGEREPAKDVVRVLGRFVDAIAARTFRQELVDELAAHSSVPIINALTDQEHPCQALADLLTIRERLGGFAGHRVAYIGDGNNVATSLLIGGATVGLEVTIACPTGFEPPTEAVALASQRARESGGGVRIVTRPEEAADGADVLYTDVWTSMGQETEAAIRREAFAGYVLDQRLVERANPDVIVMHDLPAHRGEEIEDDVIEGIHSVVFDQAENRMHAQKALLVTLINGS